MPLVDIFACLCSLQLHAVIRCHQHARAEKVDKEADVSVQLINRDSVALIDNSCALGAMEVRRRKIAPTAPTCSSKAPLCFERKMLHLCPSVVSP
jgi:hypothetical protein